MRAPQVPVPPHRRRSDLVLQVNADESERIGLLATDGLADRTPQFSAKIVLTHGQKVVAVVVVVVLAIVALFFPIGVGRFLVTCVTLIYGAAVFYRLRCFTLGLKGADVHHVSDEDALAFPDSELPIYTVLVPAYREPEVIGQLLANLEALDYPREKLDVMILLEADDDITLPAAVSAAPQSHVRVVIVPPAALTTKPRACNYGLEFARGSLVTIFDAEDEPDPLQLRKAAIVFGQRPENVACLQARLAYSNADQNIITKWFTAEYLTWFNHFLPGLAALGSPIPLGGTSNHLRLSVLRDVGAWDPYNVTEDADLGLRLARLGYEVENLDSVTFEEANSDFINWVKQRSRWLKGYLLTWLVHMRHPVQLRRELGWRGFAGVTLFLGATPMLSLLNPLLWTSTLIWFADKPHVMEELFQGPIYFIALLTWILGNFAIVYMGLVSIRETGRQELLASTLLVPLYWVMMALAAVKGVLQLIRDPSYWEKTTHGLGSAAPVAAEPGMTDTGGLAGERGGAVVRLPQAIAFTGSRSLEPQRTFLRFWQEPDPANPRVMRLVTQPRERYRENVPVEEVTLPQGFVFPAAEKSLPKHSPVLRLWLEPDPAAPRVHRLVTETRPADRFIDLREDEREAFRELIGSPGPAGTDVVRAGALKQSRDGASRRPKGRHRGAAPRKNPGR